MGERDRNYDRGEGRYERDESSPREPQRGARSWEPQSDYYRGSGRERFGELGGPQSSRDYGSSYGNYDYGRSQRIAGSYDDERSSYDPDSTRRRYETQTRYGRDVDNQNDRWNERGSSYDPSFGRSYGGGSYSGGSYGGGSYGTGYRDTSAMNRSPGREQMGQSGGYGGSAGYGSYYGGYEGERGGQREESFGQQMREAGQRIVGKVKRAFRGTKGYKRSDDRIREDVNDRLSEQDDFDPSEIEVSVSNGEVTLSGSVEFRRAKFLAEELADDVGGVSEVHNQLRISSSQSSMSGITTSESTSAVGTTATAGSGTEASRTRNARAQ